MKNLYACLLFSLPVISLFGGCSAGDRAISDSPPPDTAISTGAQPRNDLTPADIAKLKWIEGTWRGRGEVQEPFFERYRFEGTSMIVESFKDETLDEVTDSSRYELINGEFGRTKGARRSAASEITDSHVQFVPVSGGGNSYRFERQHDGTWRAVLDSPRSGDRPAGQVIYKMEPYEQSK